MKMQKRKGFIANLMIFIILPIVINIILESFGTVSLLGGIRKLITDPYVFMCNTLIIAATVGVGVLFGRFRYLVVSTVSICWLALGGVNCMVLSKRTLPFTAYDLEMLDTLPMIMKKYLGPVYLALVCIIAVCAVLGVFILLFRSITAPKRKGSVKLSLIYFVVITLVLSLNTQLAIHSGALETRFRDLPVSFVKNGFAYSFVISLLDNGVERVDGYSEELINSITVEFSESDPDTLKTPNVIFLQMESFFDIGDLNCVEFSEDPIPNFRKMMNTCPSGLLTVPVVGAGTANTEFEVVTGMRAADFGSGEYPYMTILKKSCCESLATSLKPHGYTSHFIHNYRAVFYSRNTVYANLGYDNFFSVEYMTGYEKNENGWARDKILQRYINECLDSTQGADLVTAVSVQAHGKYTGISDFEGHIRVTQCDDPTLISAYEYYINQIYEMDAFIAALTESLEKREENTILVIYGDHLPTIGFDNEDLKNRSIYQTDYVIWSNTGIEYGDRDLYSYQLSSYILESMGVRDGVINSCHQNYKDEEDYLFCLQALEYDLLYGECYAYGGTLPYNRSNMSVNRRRMSIESIKEKKDEKGVFIVKGEGFSEKTVVRVGYSVKLTKYIDEHTLIFNAQESDLDIPITVWELNIGESDEFYYSKPSGSP